jgi:hypothetical protein
MNRDEQFHKAVDDVLSAYTVDGPVARITQEQRQILHSDWSPLAKAPDELVKVSRNDSEK